MLKMMTKMAYSYVGYLGYRLSLQRLGRRLGESKAVQYFDILYHFIYNHEKKVDQT